MKFRHLLTQYRERKNLSKTGLAERVGVTPTTIMEWESGRKNPPSIEKCRTIANILGLSPDENTIFTDAAMEERLSDEALLWLAERDKKINKASHLSNDIMDALSDPVAVKALLATHKTSDDFKRLVTEIVENMENLSPAKRKEILRLCHG